MTEIPTRRGLGRTRGLLTLLAVLVLGAAVGAAAYAARQREPRAAAEPRPAASAGWTPPTASIPPSTTPRASASTATAGHPSASIGTTASQQAARPPDSAVEPALADPAAGLTPVPQQTWDTPPTCGQWRDLLSGEQRTAYASAQLRAAWKNDGSAGTPPASTVRAYRAAITAACAGKARADGNVSDVARAVYTADPATWGP